jgi:cardiolipin synthase
MKTPKGFVESIAASGGVWAGFEAAEVKTLLFESLREAKNSIQISIFSLGEKNDEMREFFQIIEDKLKARRTVQFIINDMEGDLVGEFSKNKLNKLMKYDNFDLQNFVPKNRGDLLHAKIIVVDRKFALIGSANLSHHGLFSNYEIMIKVTGGVAADIANLLDKLAVAIRNDEAT